MCKKSSSIAFAMGILAGVAGGVLAGVLFAPKSGKESREEVKEAFKTITEKCNPEINKVKKPSIWHYQIYKIQDWRRMQKNCRQYKSSKACKCQKHWNRCL